MRVLAALIAIPMLAVDARACTNGSAMRYYFFGVRPEGVEVANLLPVEIIEIKWNVARARVDDRFAVVLGGRDILIELPDVPESGNCVDYGISEGRALIVFERVFTRVSGEIVVVARSVKGRVYPEIARSAAELDKYIVDPTIKSGRPHHD